MKFSVKKFFVSLFVITALVLAGFGLWIKDKYVVPIMMFHFVNTQSPEELNTISPDNFEKLMAYLKKNGYQVISLGTLVESIQQGKQLGRKSVVITFDDGYEDNYIYGFPVLQKYGFPATIFMVSGAVEKENYLNERQIKEMLDSGLMDIGSHTQTHQYLPEASGREHLVSEIQGSKKDLENLLGRPVRFFCYPSGGFSDEIKSIVQNSGYEAALTTNRGYDKLNHDVFELKRIRFNDKDYNSSIFMKLSGYYRLFKKDKSPY